MKTLLSLVTRILAGAFHAFVQGRLKAEVSDPETTLTRDSTGTAVEKNHTSKRQRPLRESQATPIHWAEFSHSNLPTIGVL